MRIISGIYSGKRTNLNIPTGVRPTQDSVKESLFNILENYIDFEDIVVADICAGTGSLAFESLSRGAKFAHIVDSSKKVCSFIHDYSTKISIPKESFKIYNSDAIKFAKNVDFETEDCKIDILFTDPPYAVTFLSEMLSIVEKRKLIKYGGLAVIEHSKMQGLLIPESWDMLKDKNYGDTEVKIYMIGEMESESYL